MQKYEKSRDTWRNRKVWPWSKKWSREKANRVLPREHTVHGKHPQVYIWTSPDGQYQNQIDYVLCSRRWGSSIQSAKTRPGADCGLDHELVIAKFRLKLTKVGQTTRPIRYDLNQILYDYIVEGTNRFKGLDLIEYLKNYGRRSVILYRRQWSRPSPRKRNAKRQNGCLRRSYKQLRKEKLKAKEKRKDLKAEFQKIARRDKKAFLSDQCKERGKQQNGKD